MKARIKETGEIVEVKIIDQPCVEDMYVEKFGEMSGRMFHITELDFDNLDYPDYWTRLEHTCAGMAMQGMMSYIKQITPKEGSSYCDDIVDISFNVAHALVEKMKEEK